jgi:hypothetical protein
VKRPHWPRRVRATAAWRPRRRVRPVPAGRTPKRTVVAVAIPAAVVTVIAGLVSYNHIVALGLRTHQGTFDAHLLPGAIDGLIVAGSVILAAGSVLGWLAVIPGVAATLFSNLQFGLPHGVLSAVVSTWPAIAFTVASFVIERWLRRRHEGAAQTAPGVPADSLDAAIRAMLATAAAGNPLSGRQVEARFGLKRPVAAKVRELVLASVNGSGDPLPDE